MNLTECPMCYAQGELTYSPGAMQRQTGARITIIEQTMVQCQACQTQFALSKEVFETVPDIERCFAPRPKTDETSREQDEQLN